MISSIQNPKVKLVRQLLTSKKGRIEAGLFVIEGVRLIEEAINAKAELEFTFFSNQLSDRGRVSLETLTSNGVDVEEISSQLMERISDTHTSQGILMAVRLPSVQLDEHLNLVLVLDQLRDPGNLGTLMRSAAALGIQAVVLTPGCTDVYAPKVLRSGMGAHFKLAVAEMNAEEIRAFCKPSDRPQLDILLADCESGQICWDEDLTRPICLVIGGEAAGAENDIRQIIDAKVRIPMMDNSESFNAAVAGSILMYETYQQRTRT